MTPSDVPDFNRLQEFVRDASPSNWLEYAEELRDSAEVIWLRNEESVRLALTFKGDQAPLKNMPISSVSRTYILLAGFALENVLKGNLVAADPLHVNRGMLSDELKSHDIRKLAAKLPNFQMSEHERIFCDDVTTAIPYWGRYPIPLHRNQVSPEVGVNEARRQTFLGLFERLAHYLYWAIRDGWESGVGPRTIRIRSSRYGDLVDPKEPLF